MLEKHQEIRVAKLYEQGREKREMRHEAHSKRKRLQGAWHNAWCAVSTW